MNPARLLLRVHAGFLRWVRRLVLPGLLLLLPAVARAQWMTQTLVLRPGWNAVYLHVDASHTPLDVLIGGDASNPISEVWRWVPPTGAGQFVDSPQQPTPASSQWLEWNRPAGSDSLTQLGGNVAYLVRNSSASAYTWKVLGRPVPPRYDWTVGGANFIGFPTPEVNPPLFDTFLAPAPALRSAAEIHHYPGGEAGTAPPAAQRLFATLTHRLERGRAYWIRAGSHFNRYYGPFEVSLQDPKGVHYGDAGGPHRLRIRNLTSTPRTVRMVLRASEAGPNGVVPPSPPLLVRGAMDLTRLTYGHTALGAGPQEYALAAAGQPGAEVEVVLGVDRPALTSAPGVLNAAILRFTDTSGLSQIDVPVTAAAADQAGLWVGTALINAVNADLKAYAKATNDLQLTSILGQLGLSQGNGTNYVRDTNTFLISVTTTNGGGHYLVTNRNTGAGAVFQPFPLRLLVHLDTNRQATLLQQVFVGVDATTNAVLSLTQAKLHPGFLGSARRITAPHLPWSERPSGWPMTADSDPGEAIRFVVDSAYDDHASNPFLHTYHPDHDNLDAEFTGIEPVGAESYGIKRRIELDFQALATDFATRTAGGSRREGLYLEELELKGREYETATDKAQETRKVVTSGRFVLQRVSPIPSLAGP